MSQSFDVVRRALLRATLGAGIGATLVIVSSLRMSVEVTGAELLIGSTCGGIGGAAHLATLQLRRRGIWGHYFGWLVISTVMLAPLATRDVATAGWVSAPLWVAFVILIAFGLGTTEYQVSRAWRGEL